MEVIVVIVVFSLIASALSKTRDCRVCGAEISKTAYFCPHCGERY